MQLHPLDFELAPGPELDAAGLELEPVLEQPMIGTERVGLELAEVSCHWECSQGVAHC